MKLLKRISRLRVKRSFIVTPYLRKFGVAAKRAAPLPTPAQYLRAITKAKRIVRRLGEKQVDRMIDYRKRREAYNGAEWFLGFVSPNEVGVWKGAGGLPVSWTRGSLLQTARRVKTALEKNSRLIKKRAKRAIPAILAFRKILQKEKYVLPIIFKSGFGTNGRKGLQKMSGDIDDGCMRSIAFTIAGDKKFLAYIGFPRSKKKK
jgi:hypothetical protein